MKKAMIIPEIRPDARMVAAYDREVAQVESLLVELRKELKGGGYDATDEQVLNAAFKVGWLESNERTKYNNYDDPVRVLLSDMAVAKVSALAARIDDIRVQIAKAGFIHDDEHVILRLKRSDIESVGGVLRVKRSRRDSFIDEHTRRLDNDEARCYIELADILPRLQRLKADGWSVFTIVEGRVGRFDWQKGIPGTEHLAEDVVKYRKMTRK